jgi:exodeoxyribonuclease-3
MIRVVTLNLNGIRSAFRKGWLEWVAAQQPDVLCVQEVKAQLSDLDEALLRVAGMPGHFHCAQKKGYSGVALYSKREPLHVRCGFGNEEFDAEGRYVEADFGAFTVISVYVPSGSSSEERQVAKYRFLDAFAPHLRELRASGREIILCGDVNIAHREIDLKNWRSNQKNSGFLPEERAWLGKVFDEIGWVDVYRKLHPEATGESYTWWSNRGQSWANNVGWRLDYQIATPGIAAKARRAEIYKEARFSDHAPLTVDYEVFA